MGSTYKIIHTEASNGWGGQEIRIFSEAEWLREQGHEVIIVNPEEGQLYQKCKEAGFRTLALPLAKKTQLTDFFTFKAFLKKEQPDIVATHSSVDSWVGLLAASLCKVPCRLRYRHISAPVKVNATNRWQYHKLCDHILTTGECIRTPLIQGLGLPEDKVDVVATGLRFPSDLIGRETARLNLCQELKLPESARFIGKVAVLRSWKGHKYVIEAFDALAEQHPEHHLVIVGEGPMRPYLEEDMASVRHRDRVHMIGYRKDIWNYYRAFDMAVLASTKNEGIPQSGLQSLYSETPFIGTTVGGIPEIIQDGENGVLVAPENSDAIQNAFMQLLKDNAYWQKLSKAARPSMEHIYNIDNMGNTGLRLAEKYLGAKVS